MSQGGQEVGGSPESSQRLSTGVKLAFGGPAFAGAAMAIPIGIFMPPFYSDVVLAPLGMIALATAVARAFDALTDPVVGWLSDRTRSRWGRRKPWIALGTPLSALFFWLLFAPPAELGPGSAVLWFGITFAFFFLFQTFEGVPLAALGAELTTDYNERSSVFGVRAVFLALGTIVGAITPAILLRSMGPGHEREVFSSMAAVYGVVWMLLMFLMLRVVPERQEYASRPVNPLVPGVRRALRNRPFSILLLSAVVGAIPAAVPALLLQYFVRYVLQPEDPMTWVSLFLFAYLATGLLFVPVWMRLSQRIGKLRTFVAASSVGVCASVGYYFLGPGDIRIALALYIISGTQSMAGTFLVPAMAADVIDYDELRTGMRREAQFTSFWAIVPKLVSIPGSSVPLAILAAVGYVPNVVQAPDVQWTIQALYSVFPAAFYVVALLIIWRYPISDEAHVRIREGISSHNRGEDAVDPLTGVTLRPPKTSTEEAEADWFLDYFSPSELRLAATRGVARVLPRVLTATGVSLLVAVGAGVMAFSGIDSLEDRPHPLTVLGVVVSGLSFTGFIFHALRIGPARRLVRVDPGREAIAAHLASLDSGAGLR